MKPEPFLATTIDPGGDLGEIPPHVPIGIIHNFYRNIYEVTLYKYRTRNIRYDK